MSTEEAIMRFIMLVEVHFPRPKFSGDERREAVWMRSMREILSEFEDDVLAEAASSILRNRNPKHGDSTVFPKPAECIEACQRIITKRRLVEVAASFERDEPARRIEARAQSMPVFSITPDDLRWPEWISFFHHIGRHDIAGEAESRKLIRASRRWPGSDVVVFEPDMRDGGLLASLPAPKHMPN